MSAFTLAAESAAYHRARFSRNNACASFRFGRSANHRVSHPSATGAAIEIAISQNDRNTASRVRLMVTAIVGNDVSLSVDTVANLGGMVASSRNRDGRGSQQGEWNSL